MTKWSPEMVVGEVRGYRAWRIHPEHPIALRALHANKELLPQPVPYEATCLPGTLFNNPQGGHKRTAPQVNCSCGFYAIYRAPGLHALVENHLGMGGWFRASNIVICSVLMSGRVIKGETGVMRAEKMRIEAFLSDVGDFTVAAAQSFNKPLLGLERFLTECPLEGPAPALPMDARAIRYLLASDPGRDVDPYAPAYLPPRSVPRAPVNWSQVTVTSPGVTANVMAQWIMTSANPRRYGTFYKTS